jgi:uncharacterized membrane protein
VVEFAIVMFVILLFIVGLVAGLQAIDRDRNRDPEELLASRFARGEIDEAEYARRLAVLRDGPIELTD